MTKAWFGWFEFWSWCRGWDCFTVAVMNGLLVTRHKEVIEGTLVGPVAFADTALANLLAEILFVKGGLLENSCRAEAVACYGGVVSTRGVLANTADLERRHCGER
jgi:hypothetical protein